MNIIKKMSRSELGYYLEECNFTEEEKKIFDMLAKDLTATQISIALNISEATVNRRKVAIMDKVNGTRKTEVPIWEKACLTVSEAVSYTNVGENKIREIVDNPYNDISLRIGKKILIKRKALEKFLESATEL